VNYNERRIKEYEALLKTKEYECDCLRKLVETLKNEESARSTK
jgi:hypothetical protein